MINTSPEKTKVKELFYQEPSKNTPIKLLWKQFNKANNKISWLTDNKDLLESKFDVEVINLINAYMNDDWPQRREAPASN